MDRQSYLVIVIATLHMSGCITTRPSVPETEDYSITSSISPTKDAISPTRSSETKGLSSTATVLETATALSRAPLISYVVYGGDGEASSELNTCIHWLGPRERFLLYDDGQLFLYKSGSILEAHLSQVEIQDLLSSLERSGFYEIEDSIEAPDGYDIYDLPEEYQYGDGGWGRRITVEGRSIHIRDSLWEYIIPAIEDTLNLIETYEPPGGAVPYVPIEIEVYVLPEDSGYLSENSFESAHEWPSELPPINQVWILDEKETEIFLSAGMFSSFPDVQALISDGTEYEVITCPSRLGP
jgi:hypothetical protein